MADSENSAYFNSIDKTHLMLSGRVTRSYIEHGGTSGNRSTIEVGTMSPDRLMENMVDFSNIGTVSLDGVELATLRLGAYELRDHLEVPYRVVLDEAIELAKHFGGEADITQIEYKGTDDCDVFDVKFIENE